MKFTLTNLLSAFVLLAAADESIGQSQFAMPNPLIKPQLREQMLESARSSGRPPIPKPVEGGNGLPAPMPMPNADNGAKAQAESATEAMKFLSQYTVTAILGESAVLRTHVGFVPSNVPGASGASGVSTSMGSTGALGMGVSNSGLGQQVGSYGSQTNTANQRVKQSVLKVESGQAILVSGIKVYPQVGDSDVRFSMERNGPAVAVVSLESETANNYQLQPNLREGIDAATTAREAPYPLKSTVTTPQAGSNSSAPTPAGVSAPR